MPECFCHMHVHARTSFKDGLSPIEDLVARAKLLDQPGIALTDHGVVFGAPDLFKACKKHGIKGVIGMEGYEAVPHEFDMERDGEIFKVKWADLDGRDRYYHLTLWALNLEGWKNLCALHSRSFGSSYYATQRGKPLLDRASLERYSSGLAVGLGCMASRTSLAVARAGQDLDPAYTSAKWYADVFQGRCFMEIMGNLPEQQALIRGQRKLAARLGIPVLADNDVHYEQKNEGRENGAHHVLVQSRRFKKADTEEATDRSDDGFGSWYGSDGFFMKSATEMLATGGITPADLATSLQLLDLVDFDFSALPPAQPPTAQIPEPGDDESFDAWLQMQSADELADLAA